MFVAVQHVGGSTKLVAIDCHRAVLEQISSCWHLFQVDFATFYLLLIVEYSTHVFSQPRKPKVLKFALHPILALNLTYQFYPRCFGYLILRLNFDLLSFSLQDAYIIEVGLTEQGGFDDLSEPQHTRELCFDSSFFPHFSLNCFFD